MTENCMANCMAPKLHLQLRNKIFYYRVELPRVNNKRRYKIISLHTQNYFEAQEKIKQMIAQEEKFSRLFVFKIIISPFNQFSHKSWRIKRCCCFKNRTNLTTIRIKRGNTITIFFIFSAMTLIFGRITQ